MQISCFFLNYERACVNNVSNYFGYRDFTSKKMKNANDD